MLCFLVKISFVILKRLRFGRLVLFGHPPPPPPTYLSSLLVEGVNSTPCAWFLQMPENPVKYSVSVGAYLLYDSKWLLCFSLKGNNGKRNPFSDSSLALIENTGFLQWF